MDEGEWVACNDSEKMVSFLRVSGRLSERKGRLFAAACCRHLLLWVPVDPVDVRAVEVAERYADGEATTAELEAAGRYVPGPPSARRTAGFACRDATDTECGAEMAADCAAGNAAWAAGEQAASLEGGTSACPAAVAARTAESAAQAALLRDIFGPLPIGSIPLLPSVRAWNDGFIKKLATAIYEERTLPAGTLDGVRLGVLADALEDAGVTDPAVLAHLREHGLHVRGCWVVDMLLGRS